MSRGLAFILLLGLAAPGLRAEVTLAAVFADHAVLQQGKPVPVWGRAGPGEHVRVSFQGQTVGATADRDGRWMVLLGPLAATGVGADLVAAGRGDAAVRHDVVVGEVWLCSGQSNMEVAAADHPLLRQFAVARRAAAEPAEDTAGAWVPCSPATAGRFIAVGYFFARDLQERLGVPVGIIDCSWEGAPIEAWMSPAALAADPAFAALRARREQSPPVDSRRPPSRPAGLFDGMVNPLLPYALRGILWCQDASNPNGAAEYHRLFAAMTTAWRAHFGQRDLPFYWVQLAKYHGPSDPTGTAWAYLREAQAQALSLPATGMAVTIDLGDPRNIHPVSQQEVGRRLALIAKARVYGITEDFSGPVAASVERSGAGLRVRFRDTAGGLTAADRPLQSFEIAGADRKFHPASAAIAGDTVRVSSPQVPDPVAVRYAWRNDPDANFYNSAGLPAAPFRTDDW